MNNFVLLDPKLIVIECSSACGGVSYLLTDITRKTSVRKACSSAAKCIKKEHGQEIEFSLQSLKEFIESNDILFEIANGNRYGFEDIDPAQLCIANIFLPVNSELLHRIVDELFDTGYDSGIIADYIDVTVLKAGN